LCGLLAASFFVWGANDQVAVKVIADQSLEFTVAEGRVRLPLYASSPLNSDSPSSDIERAVVVIHGTLRNADVYWRSTQKAAQGAPEASAHTLLIVPQFLAVPDARAHQLPPGTLFWPLEGWKGGDAAVGPLPVSSFMALDALLRHLADRVRYPRLTEVVVAGHSAGAQVVQRYAVVGEGEADLRALGVTVRYVVANPSSYLYFSADRPQTVSAGCTHYNQWKYGWENAPAYAQKLSPIEYETRYASRDVIYLLGTADINPHHPALDTSCSGEAQGPYRYARGHAYFDYLHQRQPQLRHRVWDVPSVGHDGERMLGSACGLMALFGDPRSASDCLRS
jgi:pimeloyl-ACP methyl ester carboxylesterase